jgi:cell division protein FtsB
MGETEDRLYGLMEVVERQQAAVQAALAGLAAERLALQAERKALALGVKAVEGSAAAAVRSAVSESLIGVASTAAATVQVSTRPLLEKLDGVAAGAEQAQVALRRVVLWASWRLLGWVVGAVAGLVLLGWLASAAVLWWDTGAIEAAQMEKMRLQTEVAELKGQVAEMQANREGWVKAGMLERLQSCGPGNRPCVRVNEAAGKFGKQEDIRVLGGY